MTRIFRSFLALTALVAGCGGGVVTDPEPPDAGAVYVDAAAEELGPPGPAFGLTVTSVKAYQGSGVTLMQDGAEVAPEDRNAPIVLGRDLYLRVFVKPRVGWKGRQIVGRLEVSSDGASTTLPDVKVQVNTASDEGKLTSTFNFLVSGASITADAAYSVSLWEVAARPPDLDASADPPRYPAQDFAPFAPSDSNGPLHLVLLPFAYDGDGSGRLPDTSEAQIQAFRDRFFSTYPVPDVEITVRDPVSLGFTVSPDPNSASDDWGRALVKTCNVRQQDRVATNVWYYGLFNPADDLATYCGGGCALGVGPGGQSSDYFRCAIGLGYTDTRSTFDTALQEIAHSMGRSHAPCDVTQSLDPDFPYPNGSIGVYGYDLVTKKLMQKATADFMSYCHPVWVSDYTFGGIFDVISGVNAQAQILFPPGFPARWRSGTVDPSGRVRWAESFEIRSLPAGEPRSLALLDAHGRVTGHVRGYYTPILPLAGGIVLVPEGISASASARIDP